MKLMINYDYKNSSHPERVPFTSGYLLEQALGKYFEITHDEAELVFNMVPLNPSHPFVKGEVTFIYDNESKFNEEADWVYYSTEKKLDLPNSSLLMDATIPEYRYYPTEFRYEVGFLGRQYVRERAKVIDILDRNFRILNGAMELGEPSARKLSECKLLIIIDDYNEMGMNMDWIDRRIFTFGNIRPILVPFNKDYLMIGKPNEDYIAYHNHDEMVEKIRHYLSHMGEAERIGNNLKEKLKAHTYDERAKQIRDKYEYFLNRNTR